MRVTLQDSGPPVVVRVEYAGAGPAEDIEVTVYSPSAADEPVRRMLSGEGGLVEFIPPEAGDWLLVADDGMGHRTVLEGKQGIPLGEAPSAGLNWSVVAPAIGLAMLVVAMAAWRRRDGTRAP